MNDVRTINWLEVTAWFGLTAMLLLMLGVALRNVWEDKVRRIEALESWRTLHEAAELETKLLMRDLQHESKGHTDILKRMEKQIQDVAALVGNRRRADRWEAAIDPTDMP
jgi:hypothetical protein